MGAEKLPPPYLPLQRMANETLNTLLQYYRNDKRVEQLVATAEAGAETRVLVSGTIGSQRAFVIAAQWLARNAPTLVIADDKEEAAYLLNDLESLLPERRVLFLPDSFKRPGAFEDYTPDNALQRTEVVNPAGPWRRDVGRHLPRGALRDGRRSGGTRCQAHRCAQR